MALTSILRAWKRERPAQATAKGRRKAARSTLTSLFELTPLEQRILLSNSNVLFYDYTTGANGGNVTWTSGSSQTVYNGPNQTGQPTTVETNNPSITINNVPQHSSLTVLFSLVVFDCANNIGVTCTADGTSVLNSTFSNSWVDHNNVTHNNKQGYPGGSSGSYPSGTGSMPGGGDLDGDNFTGTGYDPTADSVYTISKTFRDTQSTVTVNFTLPGYSQGATYWAGIESVGIYTGIWCPTCTLGTVNPATGDVTQDPALTSAGFGAPLNAGFGWGNTNESATGGTAGNNTLPDSTSSLVQVAPGAIGKWQIGGAILGVIDNAGNTRFFQQNSAGNWVEQYGGTDQLVSDGAGHYVVTDSNGNEAVFYDFTAPAALQGKLYQELTPGQAPTAYSYDSNGNLTEIVRSNTTGSVTTKESFLYTYLGQYDPNAGKVQSVLLRRKVFDTNLGQSDATTPYVGVRSLVYTYYTSSDVEGNAGDLKLVQSEDAGPTVSATGTSGTLPVSYYYYQVTAVTAGGEGNPSTPVMILPSSGGVALSWPVVPNATSYKIYRSTAEGQETYYDTASTNSYTDSTNHNPNNTPPPTAVIDTTYYRYYTPNDGDPHGYVGGLKYVVGPQSYARLAATLSTDPTTATDSYLAPYADDYYQYDSSQRVTEAVVQGQGCSSCSGGLGTFTYAYANSGFGTGYNVWSSKTTETLPDGTIRYHYYNSYGQEMLSVTKDPNTGVMNGTFTEYDNKGHAILVASSSAVNLSAGLSTLEQYPDLLNNTTLSYTTTPSYEYLNASAGLITINDYYQNTTATQTTPGGAAGFIEDTQVEDGQAGTPVMQEKWQYFAMGGAAIGSSQVAYSYPVASDTVYGLSGQNDARTTSYYYTWYSNSNQIYSEITIPPVISGGTSGQNGPGTVSGTVSSSSYNSTAQTQSLVDPSLKTNYPAWDFVGWAIQNGGYTATVVGYDPSTGTLTFTSLGPVLDRAPVAGSGYTLIPGATEKIFDQYGRVTWTKDAAGYINYTAYDMGTGAVTKTITDVDTTKTSDFTNLPAGWSTRTGGGLHEVTSTQVDGLGRPTKETDANGNVTYTVYNDTYATSTVADLQGIRNEVQVFPDWSGYTTTGPVEITHEYRPVPNAPTGQQTLYDETLTESGSASTIGGVPDGVNQFYTTDIQSLSRDLTNNAGQKIETDAYSSLSGLTYSYTNAIVPGAVAGTNIAAGNYSATLYSYDHDGRLNRTVDPNGTINRTVYDGFGRVVSRWIGTNDTPASGYWSPTNNTAPSNMVDVEDDYYDQRLPGPTSPPALGQTSGGALPATTYYVVITYVTPNGETAASAEASYSVSASNVLTVAAPASTGWATGYNVYVSTASGQEQLQNATPISLGNGWTESTTGLASGAMPPANLAGDSNRTETVRHPGGGAADRVTLNLYDWRDRLLATKQGALMSSGSNNLSGETGSGINRQITYYSLDNQGETVGTYVYAGDGTDLNAFVNWTSSTDSTKLRAYTSQSFDDQGRVYRSLQCSIDPSSGAIGSNLATNDFYDTRGDLIDTAAPGGGSTKRQYDGAGNDIKDSTTDGGAINAAPENWLSATTTSGDVVIEQNLNYYDKANNPIETINRQRFDNDSTTATGDLAGPGGGNLASRDYYSASYYDPANRLTSTVNAGTNGGTTWTRPSSPPAASDTVLVTSYGYRGNNVQQVLLSPGVTAGTFQLNFVGDNTVNINWNASAATVQADIAALPRVGSGNVIVAGSPGAWVVEFTGSMAGNAMPSLTVTNSALTGGSASVALMNAGGDNGMPQSTTDPRGIVSVAWHDMLGRTTGSIAAFTDGTPTNSTNQTTTFGLDGNGDTINMTAVLPAGQNSQTTAYVYGVAGTIGTNLFSNDLVATVEYPDKSTGKAATVASEQTSTGYNWQGQKTTFTDQNGTTHTYNYDVLGRLTADIITTLGSGVDGTVRRLGYNFNDAGLPFQQTSYSDTGGTSVVNQVQDAYNGYGQLTAQYQSDSGGVVVGTTGAVQYVYSQPTGYNYSRLSAMIYPNTRQLDYNYTSTLDNAISRIDRIADHAGSAAGNDQSYTYLGLSTIVQFTDGNGTALTYIEQPNETNVLTDGGDRYTGLDRFGRVIDQNWINTGTGASIDRIQYAHDADGNVLYANNLVNSAFSELYGSNGAGDNSYDQLNRLAHFSRGTLSSSGSNGSLLDTISSPSTTNNWTLDALGNWLSSGPTGSPTSNSFNSQNQETSNGSNGLAFDNNGNMLTDEQGYHYVYDAWNRMVQARNQANTATKEVFQYDALGRGVMDNNGSGNEQLYYNTTGNVVQEQFGSIYCNYVWGLGYVNNLVLRDRNYDGNMSTGNYGYTGSGLEERIYAQQDASWNTVSLADSSGNVTERMAYDPYGNVTVLTPSWGTGSDGNNWWVYFFQGMRLVDDGTNFSMYRSQTRTYDVNLGRWGQDDPEGYIDSMNMYSFVKDGPVTYQDPTGLQVKGVGGAKVGARVMAAASQIVNALEACEACEASQPKLNSDAVWTAPDELTVHIFIHHGIIPWLTWIHYKPLCARTRCHVFAQVFWKSGNNYGFAMHDCSGV